MAKCEKCGRIYKGVSYYITEVDGRTGKRKHYRVGPCCGARKIS